MNKVIVTRRNNVILSIEYCDGEPIQIYPSYTEAVTLGSIYVGRVSKVKKDIGAAFVDFLPGQTGFLQITKNNENTIKEGRLLAVRVINEPVKTKGYTLSDSIEIAGKYCVLSDKGQEIHFSSKLSNEDAKKMKEMLSNEYEDRMHGGIIRTNANVANFSLLLDEYKALDQELENIIKHGDQRSLYSCLYKEKPSFLKAITDIKDSSYDEIITDDQDIFETIKSVLPTKVRLYSDERISLDALYRVKNTISLAKDKKVNLNCGGYLYIEPTEALTVIDVNSGKFDAKKDKNEMIKKVNFEAAAMVAKQLKLRNISGMIVVDFINFNNHDDEEELLSFMRGLLKNDNCKCKVYGFTALKFMEIARQKIRASVYDFDF